MRKSETTTSEFSCSHCIAGREVERFLTELALKLSERKQMKYSFDRNSLLREKSYLSTSAVLYVILKHKV